MGTRELNYGYLPTRTPLFYAMIQVMCITLLSTELLVILFTLTNHNINIFDSKRILQLLAS